MQNYNWTKRFLELFDRCLREYQSGNEDFNSYYSDEDLLFLARIGYKEREFFDFIEDFGDGGEPSREDAVLIASVRRDYFREIQDSEPSKKEMKPDQLPGRDEELGGYNWLPRIIQKAENKLRGENDPDIMYSCGGDRGFLTKHDIHPADFLRVVWAADGDHDQIVDWINAQK